MYVLGMHCCFILQYKGFTRQKQKLTKVSRLWQYDKKVHIIGKFDILRVAV